MGDINNEFYRFLKYYIGLNELTQKELADRLGVKESTVSMWCAGKRIPPMKRITEIAEILNVTTSDLLGDNSNEENYYLDDESREAAQFLFENPEYKVLFDASKKVKKEDIDFVKKMIDKFSE